MLTPERWRTVRDIFEQALELAPEKRARFLEVACSSDSSLLREVQSLLAADQNAASGFLESPLLPSSLLTPGARLGDYEIISRLGSGGMGIVYSARDLRLGRPVAIKVLTAHLSADASRLRHFEQEAQSAAALNHPNIIAVHQLGVHGGAPYLVSELLEGETLRDELNRGAIPQLRASELGEQIADGLSAAHQRGIIHRDLKPENLYVTKGGRLKILDFGLAKLLEDNAETQSGSPTQTQTGIIAGTVGYISPEQLRGEKLDARTDLFSFGVVLYEMATGQRPFAGATSGVVIEGILNRHPAPPAQLNARVSPEFDRIITKALEKDREVRYQGAAEIRADLKRLRRDSDSSRGTGYAPPASAQKSKWPRPLKSAALPTLFVVLVIAVWLGYSFVRSAFSHSGRPFHNFKAQIAPPPLNAFRLAGDIAGPPVISPNGAYLAFTATAKDGTFKLWIRPLNSVEARALPDTEGAFFPFWSPDSNSLAFFADGKLKTINVATGSPVALCDAPDGRGGTWGANGDILFTPQPTAPLLRVKATGGTPQLATKLDAARHTTHRWPFFLPDQKHFLYFAANHETSRSGDNMVYYASLDGRENRALFHADTNAIFADGFLLFANGANLMARAFDLNGGQPTREPVLVARGAINDPVTWHVDVSVSDDGVLVYGGVGLGSRQLVWLDRSTYQQTGVAVDGLSQLFLARLSPQGDRIVMQKDHEGDDISVYDLRDKITVTSIPKRYSNYFPIWSPDGKWIAYASARDGQNGIYRFSADGSGKEEELLRDEQRLAPRIWMGNNLLYVRGQLGNQFECWVGSLEDGGKRKVLDSVDDCTLSPDGRWLAYAAHESLPPDASPGPLKVFVTNFLTGQGRYQASENSGIGPQWSSDGKDLYYLEQSTLTLVRTEVRVSGGVPHFRVLEKGGANMLNQPLYAVSPDQKRILIERIPDPTVVVVTNFADSLDKN